MSGAVLAALALVAHSLVPGAVVAQGKRSAVALIELRVTLTSATNLKASTELVDPAVPGVYRVTAEALLVGTPEAIAMIDKYIAIDEEGLLASGREPLRVSFLGDAVEILAPRNVVVMRCPDDGGRAIADNVARARQQRRQGFAATARLAATRGNAPL